MIYLTLHRLQNSTKDKNMTLASYLDLQHAPTRETLIADIVKQGIPGKVYPELQPLFKILEVDFQPLKVGSSKFKFHYLHV